MDWQHLWLYYLILFVTVVIVAGANLWAWKRERNWRWWSDGVASVIILGMVLAILLPVMTPRPGWYARNNVLAITFSPDGACTVVRAPASDRLTTSALRCCFGFKVIVLIHQNVGTFSLSS